MSRLLGAIALLGVLSAATPVMAQDAPALEISAGYNFLRALGNDGDEAENLPVGWYADIAGNVTPTFGIVGQITGNYKEVEEDLKISLHTFAGGARVMGGGGGVRPFGQVLFGVVRSSATFEVPSGPEISDSASDPFLQLGAGVNVWGGGGVGVRVGADYIRVFEDGEGTNVIRFAVGVVFGG